MDETRRLGLVLAARPTTTSRPLHDAPLLDDATRHLCVGAYVDQAYCADVLRKVFFDRSRRLAPSYGFALPPVLAHARRAWLLDLGQHVAVVVIAVAALYCDPFSAAAAATVLFSWIVARRLARVGRGYLRFLGGRTDPEETDRIAAQRGVLVTSLVGAWAGLLLVFMLTQGAPRLRQLGNCPLWIRLGGLLVLLAATVVVNALCRQQSVDRLRPGAVEPNWRNHRRLLALHDQQGRAVTVYSGGRPFVGSGVKYRTWSFAQLLKRQGVEEDPSEEPGFSAVDLVRFLQERIQGLAFDPVDERRLPDLTVRDHIFVDGTYARDVPEHPQADDFSRVISDTTGHSRHFLACQVPSWHGEVVTTVYVHVSLQGRTLYLEFSTRALLPTRPEFHVVDRIGGTGPRAHLRSFLSAIWALPEALGRMRQSVLVLASAVGGTVGGERWSSLQARGVDVGTTVSVRELGAVDLEDKVEVLHLDGDINYFQIRDVVKHSQVIERRLLDAVLDFLRSRGFDTDEYEQRAITILNSGIVHTGSGDVKVTGVVGESGTYNNGQPSGGNA